MLTTSALDSFRIAYLGATDSYMAWRNGYPVEESLAQALTPDERVQAGSELLEAVRAGNFDGRAVQGLGYLYCTEAIPLLHQLMQREEFISYALQSIAHIDPRALDQSLVLKLLTSKVNWRNPLLMLLGLLDPWRRFVDILVGLRTSFTLTDLEPRLLSRILALLAHKDYLVRYHALYALRQLYNMPINEQGDKPTIYDGLRRDELFPLIRTNKTPESYRQAQEAFLASLSVEARTSFR